MARGGALTIDKALGSGAAALSIEYRDRARARPRGAGEMREGDRRADVEPALRERRPYGDGWVRLPLICVNPCKSVV